MSNNFTKRKSSLFTGIQVGCTILMVIIAVCTYNAADKSADAARDSADAATKANEISERFYQLETEPQITLLTPKLTDKEINYIDNSQPLIYIFVTNPSKYTIPDVGVTFYFVEWGPGIMNIEKAKERSEIGNDSRGYELIDQIKMEDIVGFQRVSFMIDAIKENRDINNEIRTSCLEFLENLPQDQDIVIKKYIHLGVLFPNEIYRIRLPNNLQERCLYIKLRGFDEYEYLYHFKVKEESSN